MIVLGTRPECIKLAPVIWAMPNTPVVNTGQHEEMLDPFLDLFCIKPKHSLKVMTPGQDLSKLTSTLMQKVSSVIEEERPTFVAVQGDTTTAMAAALSAFYFKVPVAHVEAGLRTHDQYSPFPEEVNRQIISRLASFHFCPTEGARDNLLQEGIKRKVFVVGNTVVDSLKAVLHKTTRPYKDPYVVATLHRRENIGPGIDNVGAALERLASLGHKVVVPVHKNPEVAKQVSSLCGVDVVEHMDYLSFIGLLNNATLVISDSGGVLEEAVTLGVPVLIARDKTERPEALRGSGELVGTNPHKIFQRAIEIIKNPFRGPSDVFGDGNAGKRIANILKAL